MESNDQRLQKLEQALAIAKRVGNTFLEANIKKAIEEAKRQGIEP